MFHQPHQCNQILSWFIVHVSFSIDVKFYNQTPILISIDFILGESRDILRAGLGVHLCILFKYVWPVKYKNICKSWKYSYYSRNQKNLKTLLSDTNTSIRNCDPSHQKFQITRRALISLLSLVAWKPLHRRVTVIWGHTPA